MHEPGANSEHSDGTAQRGRKYGCIVEYGVMIGPPLGVAWLTSTPIASLLAPHTPPQWQLATAGGAYALAIVAAVFLGLGHNIPEGLPKLFLLSLVLSIILFPTFLGSACIAAALNQLAGWHVGSNGLVLLALLLWVVMVFGIVIPIALVIARRTRVDG